MLRSQITRRLNKGGLVTGLGRDCCGQACPWRGNRRIGHRGNFFDADRENGELGVASRADSFGCNMQDEIILLQGRYGQDIRDDQ